MAINIFEGGRRIAKIVTVIWIIGWSVGAYYTYESVKPTVNVTYKITGFKEAPVRIMEECPPDSIMNYVDMKTKSGTKVLVKLCREKPKISDLMALAKNLEEEGDIKLAGRALDKIYNLFINKKSDSTERAQLEAALVKADTNGDTDEAWIDNQGRSLLQKQIGIGAMVAIGGILFLWVFTWSIGWIVRGFMGVPRGQDNK